MLHSLSLYLPTTSAAKSVGITDQFNDMKASASSPKVVLLSLLFHFYANHGLTSVVTFALRNFAKELEAAPATLHVAVPAGELPDHVIFRAIPEDEVFASVNSTAVVKDPFQRLVALYTSEANKLSSFAINEGIVLEPHRSDSSPRPRDGNFGQ